jgi:hypothetical protein
MLITSAHRKVYDFIYNYIGAPTSNKIAQELNADLHGVQIILSELSQEGITWRSKKGLYRIQRSLDAYEEALGE